LTFFVVVCLVMLGIKPLALCMLNSHSTSKLYPEPSHWFSRDVYII
jgi:hypothetical protein